MRVALSQKWEIKNGIISNEKLIPEIRKEKTLKI